MKTTIHIAFISWLVLLSGALPAQNKPKVVATASMIADMAKNIAGDKLDIQCIVPIGSDPHLHEPTPRDASLIAHAQLVLKNGLTFEGWLTKLIDNSGTKAEVVLVTEGIKSLESLTYQNSFDPHAWMDASNGLIYIRNIRDAFIELDPENQPTYEANYESYKKKLETLDRFILEQIKTIPEKKRILITSHDAFQYYGRRYGIRLESIMGTSTDADVQTADIMRVSKIIRESEVPAIFAESTINPKLMQQLAKDNKIRIGGQLYTDSVGDKDSPAPTYYDMLKHNTVTIVNALRDAQMDDLGSTGKTNDVQNLLFYALIGVLFFGGFFIVYKKLNR